MTSEKAPLVQRVWSLLRRQPALPLSVMVVAAVAVYARGPLDSSVVSNFREYQPEFEELAAMLHEDQEVEIVHPDYVHPMDDSRRHAVLDPAEVGLSGDRLARYRALMVIADVVFVRRYFPCDGVYLSTWSAGALDTHHSKGMVRCFDREAGDADHELTHVDGDWYIFELHY